MSELYKLLWKRKMGIVILPLIFLKLILCLMRTTPPLFSTPSDQTAYKKIISDLSGPINEDKKAFFAEEEQRRQRDQKLANDIGEMYDKGKINEYEMNERLGSLEKASTVPDSVWSYLNEQYTYVQESPKQHYFMDVSGWASLLGTEKLDFILVLLLLVVAGTGFAYEYESGMMDTLRTCCYGRWRLALIKTGCITGICVVMFLVFESVDLADALIRYGPLHGSYPIQSAKMYESVTHSLDFFTVYFITRLFRLLGVILLIASTMFLAVLSQRSVTALFGGLALVAVPYFLFGGSKLIYRFPNPAGLLIGNGYFLRGLESQNTADLNLTIQYVLIGAIIVTLIILLMCATLYIFANSQKRGNPT